MNDIKIKATHVVTIPMAGEIRIPVIAGSAAEAESLARKVFSLDGEITINVPEADLVLSAFDNLREALGCGDEVYIYDDEISVTLLENE